MEITAVDRSNIVKLIVGMFDAAPGATYLGQFESIISSGRGFALLTEDLSQSSAFLNLYPADNSSSDFVSSFLNTLLADNVTTENMQQAVDYVSNILAGNGGNRADAILQTLIALNNVSVDNAAFGAAAKAFANKAQVAEYYSVDLDASASDIATLRSVVANVGSDDASRDLALANADSMLQTSGKLIDGYIKDATVFLDANGNGVLDEGETSTTTDANGDFTLIGQGSLVAFGGTDISTGLAFEGTLRAPEGSTVITPVTTLVQAIVETGKSAEEAEQAVSEALGLPTNVDLKTFDPIEEATKEGADAAAIDTALDIQSANLKVANMLVQAAAVMQGAAGDELTAVEAMQATVDALAEKINEAAESDNTVDLADAALLEATVNSAAEKALDSIDDVTIRDGLQESVAAMADEAAAILVDANTSIAQALEDADTGQVLEALRDAVQIQTVTQGEAADAIETGAASGDLSDAQDSFSGSGLTAAAEQVEVSDDSLTGGSAAEEETEEETGDSGSGGSAPSITLSYSPDTFVEASANNGSISTTSTLTLSGGETFVGTNGQALTGAVVTNVPAGLTAVVTKTSDTTATLTFTGNATSHEDLNDVSDLTVTLGDSSFSGGDASSVTGATKSNLAINFSDADSIELNYDLTTFSESTDNDGSITDTATLTLIGDTFVGSNGQVISDVTFSNVPGGLSASLVKASDTTATLSFTGTAASHLDADDISDLTVALGDAAFVGGDASAVTGATTSDLAIDFADPVVKSLSYSATSFAEASANDGSIDATATLTLTNETFAGANGQALAGATFSNVPAGLSVSLVKASDTTATLSFTGTAGSHLDADDIADLTVTLGDAAFVGGDASVVTGATTSDLAINFADPVVKSLSYSATSFAEASANDGSIDATATLTLTNETFAGANGQAL
ncbi:MAG: hypothetical protein KC477_10610, partial [Oceanospirillaceae bacterium]|nr:hypothetical protein [Oceanospirillaceae bacterium]